MSKENVKNVEANSTIKRRAINGDRKFHFMQLILCNFMSNNSTDLKRAQTIFIDRIKWYGIPQGSSRNEAFARHLSFKMPKMPGTCMCSASRRCASPPRDSTGCALKVFSRKGAALEKSPSKGSDLEHVHFPLSDDSCSVSRLTYLRQFITTHIFLHGIADQRCRRASRWRCDAKSDSELILSIAALSTGVDSLIRYTLR